MGKLHVHVYAISTQLRESAYSIVVCTHILNGAVNFMLKFIKRRENYETHVKVSSEMRLYCLDLRFEGRKPKEKSKILKARLGTFIIFEAIQFFYL